MHAHQVERRAELGPPPPAPLQWLAETDVEGETRVAIVWSQLPCEARRAAAPVLEQPQHELVRVKQVTFKGFSRRGAS